MKRKVIDFYGFRVAEPHHDGTPHWHANLFFPSQHEHCIRESLRHYWLSEYADERGADRVRVKFVRPDAEKGTPTDYIAKYVAKKH